MMRKTLSKSDGSSDMSFGFSDTRSVHASFKRRRSVDSNNSDESSKSMFDDQRLIALKQMINIEELHDCQAHMKCLLILLLK